MHSELDQVEIFVRYDDMNERTNRSIDKDSQGLLPSERSRGIYLKLNGSEEECIFTSKEPESKPNINVS